MTYLDLIRDADRQLDDGRISIAEYEKMIEPLYQEIQLEVTEEAVKEYCQKRCLTILTNDAYYNLVSAYSSQRYFIIPL